MADKKYELEFGLSDGTSQKVEFTAPQGPEGTAGKTAYEYAKDGGYTGSEDDFKAKMAESSDITIPTALPNPHKLTFEGAVQAEYDGSGAVRVTIPNGQGTARVEKDATDTDVTIEPNKLYIFPEMETLNITLSDNLDATVVNEFHFVFQSGATATTLELPDAVKIPDSFTIDANKIYEISIMENCLTYQSWEVS